MGPPCHLQWHQGSAGAPSDDRVDVAVPATGCARVRLGSGRSRLACSVCSHMGLSRGVSAVLLGSWFRSHKVHSVVCAVSFRCRLRRVSGCPAGWAARHTCSGRARRDRCGRAGRGSSIPWLTLAQGGCSFGCVRIVRQLDH
jgi:hypothetical protein